VAVQCNEPEVAVQCNEPEAASNPTNFGQDVEA
jgi:hypothetical protein